MRESGRQQWVLPVVLVAVVVTAAAGLLAREFYPAPRAQAAPSVPAVVPTEPSAIPAADQPGPRDVRGTPDAVSHPLYETTRQLLQTHFDAINGRNYERWRTTVTPDRAKTMPEALWLDQYSTTADGSVVVYRIEVGPLDAARVMLTFTSTQDKRYAPPELPVECIHWGVVYPLTLTDGQWRLDLTTTSARPEHEAC